jgi:hypothetical protein
MPVASTLTGPAIITALGISTLNILSHIATGWWRSIKRVIFYSYNTSITVTKNSCLKGFVALTRVLSDGCKQLQHRTLMSIGMDWEENGNVYAKVFGVPRAGKFQTFNIKGKIIKFKTLSANGVDIDGYQISSRCYNQPEMYEYLKSIFADAKMDDPSIENILPQQQAIEVID